ncbi:glucose-6-phosphate dehydrogenase assembly protein OpcA [Aldersonia sp. NBC_00410]|uniref:glucose-6-phosphate dehydrogenase assembly protein OpcA n=1 Tax=Aldersonia sp. NBC_00410 TaxID=2975954 RepID=UPI00224D0619|nr:glucose-6-phosphate dehydrogenase assembly protein OpcA [Aldersonia sp. NBC_00410]MCX5045176.1 glucose-6-phosphate dehydrogenase assembly protein OpcA [Aldersonia sp. NBC_00410]
MIIEMPDTTTVDVNKKLVDLRENSGVVTQGRVLTLVVCALEDADSDDTIEAANEASKEHPCRVIALTHGDRAAAVRLDAQIRVGGDAGAGEVLVLTLHGELSEHESSVAIPFLLPDTPVVAWWPNVAPKVPAKDPLGKLAIRRITDATLAGDPMGTIRSRLAAYTPGDSDLAWSRITYWRALLTTALDEPPHDPIQSVTVSGLQEEPSLDVLAGWLAYRLGCPVRRLVGDLFVELHRPGASIRLSRPQTGRTATLHRDGQPDRMLPLARRETMECLAEDLRRLDADEIYAEALEGLERVSYE